jgi:glyoxylase-like metal-dependent hydrolase (beta-lactamase superfamily II)
LATAISAESKICHDGHGKCQSFYCRPFSPEITPVTPNTPLTKLPRSVFSHDPTVLYAFPPNRETLGGTAYLLRTMDGNLLIDSPAWTAETQTFLQAQGGVRWLFLTHRGNFGKQVRSLQATLGCEVVVQEQEAYLLPNVPLTTFQQEFEWGGSQAIWTAGHSPGSACLYSPIAGGILFTGRHLLPDKQGQPVPLRTAKTFHWPRQIRHVQLLRDRFKAETLEHICPGASLGLLRGAYSINAAYEKLQQLDLTALERT